MSHTTVTASGAPARSPSSHKNHYPAGKRCKRCGHSKPLEDFARNSNTADGRLNRCKACEAAAMRRYRREHPDRVEAAVERWKRRNPTKAHAHTLVKEALAAGRLRKPTRCEDCGGSPRDGRNLHAHHADYSKPLEVEWLCAGCHRSRHVDDVAVGA